MAALILNLKYRVFVCKEGKNTGAKTIELSSASIEASLKFQPIRAVMCPVQASLIG